jgi:hypothetical protein
MLKTIQPAQQQTANITLNISLIWLKWQIYHTLEAGSGRGVRKTQIQNPQRRRQFWCPTNQLHAAGFFLRTCYSSASKFPDFLWNPEVHYRLQNNPPFVPILSHINTNTIYQSISIISTSVLLPCTSLYSGIPTNIRYALSIRSICAIGPAHLITC